MSHSAILQPDRRVPTGARRAVISAGLRHLARKMETSHPALNTPGHLRDAARELDRGNTEGAQRHLRAGLNDLQPVNLIRHGITGDQEHTGARQHLTSIHRQLLNVKDVEEATHPSRPVLPHGGPSFETDRVTGIPAPSGMTSGNQAMNAPQAPPVGRSDRAAEGPRAPSVPSSKQQGYTRPSVGVLDLVGPKGYVHGWHYVGVSGSLDAYRSLLAHPDMAKLDSQSRAVVVHHLNLAKSAAAGGDHTTAALHLGDAKRRAENQGAGSLASAIGLNKDFHDKQATSFLPSRSGQPPSYGQWLKQTQASERAARPRLTPRTAPVPFELSAQTGRLASTPAPYGKPGGPGLYGVAGNKHSDYFEQVVKALMEKRGMDKGRASRIAWGALRRWRAGKGNVHPEVQAAATGALAQEDVARAHAHAHSWVDVETAIELAIDLGGPGSGNPNQQRGTGGKFTAGGGGTPPPGHPARTSAAARHPGRPVSQAQRAHMKGQLLARAKQDTRKANALAAQIRALLAQLHGSKSSSAAGAGKSSAAAGAAKSAAAAGTKAASSSSAPSKPGTSSSSSRSVASVRSQISQLRAQEHSLRAAAATARSQASRL